MFLLINALLLPILIFGLMLAYFHFFGGPLPHHYLYVSNCETPSDENDSSSAPTNPSSNSLFGPKNNRSPSFNSLLHRLRTFLFGADEAKRQMVIFRQFQVTFWRLYKFVYRRVFHTGELERMIVASEIAMVPLGNCMTERVGFHPHLVALSVRISSYLRSSKQLAEVLRLEEESSAIEIQRQMALAKTARSNSDGHGSKQHEVEQEAPGEGDEDQETPMSTPSLNPALSSSDPSSMSLGSSSSSSSGPGFSSPLKTFSGVRVSAGYNSASAASTIMGSMKEHHHSHIAKPVPTMASAAGFSSSTAPSSASSSSSSSSTTAASSSASTSSSSSSSSSSTLDFPPCFSLVSGESDSPLIPLAAQDSRANHLLTAIVAIKNISRTSGATYSNLLRPVLYRALIFRNEVQDFIRFQLDPVLQIKYDQTNAAHEKWLMELWELYEPLGSARKRPTSRISKEWESLGFQGDNPATDFRGMGILGLRNLMEFARTCPIESKFIQRHSSEQGLKWFGFAITGINLTADLVELTKSHALDAYYYTYGSNWSSFHALYATIFIKFDELWSEEKPENVMDFQRIHNKFKAILIQEAQTFPFSPRSLSSADFNISTITPVTPRLINENGGDSMDGEEDEDDEFMIEGAQEVSEHLVWRGGGSRRASKSQSGISRGLSRSVSPFSSGASGGGGSSMGGLSHPSSPNSHQNSPGLHALSRVEFMETGSVLPLGNFLDPVAHPAIFARNSLPPWRASS